MNNKKIKINNKRIPLIFSRLDILLLAMTFLSLGFSIGMQIDHHFFNQNIDKSISSEIDIGNINNCDNLSVSDTTICLRDFVKKFYNYTSRDERNYTEIQGTFYDVQINGGDCYDYSKMYRDMAIKLGMKSRTISIYPDEGIGHVFTVIWDVNLTEYCVIDMMNILDCVEFEQDDEI